VRAFDKLFESQARWERGVGSVSGCGELVRARVLVVLGRRSACCVLGQQLGRKLGRRLGRRGRRGGTSAVLLPSSSPMPQTRHTFIGNHLFGSGLED